MEFIFNYLRLYFIFGVGFALGFFILMLAINKESSFSLKEYIIMSIFYPLIISNLINKNDENDF
jgi:hypothetical protein